MRSEYRTVIVFFGKADEALSVVLVCCLFEKLKKERNQSTLKAAEDFVIKAKKLENDLQSLDKRASILDLRLECQDLEKISIINHFAKFHGCGQADGTETSLSSDAIARFHKFFSQRYVIALLRPRNLLDKVALAYLRVVVT
ncbi:hypothetical protein PVK06_044492 [Gossypium arboreum]|uniref:Uncharacterized protein n=1 Tax=Gossypium arboreum TaxID=29729 RepID=A0ABR0MRC0_GOSAR|nr:hypothetical protein PVK06_044492 [Gossypium arboreum]